MGTSETGARRAMSLLESSFRQSRFVALVFAVTSFSIASLKRSRVVALLSRLSTVVLRTCSRSRLLATADRIPYPGRLWGVVDKLNSRSRVNLLYPDRLFILAYSFFILASSYTLSGVALLFILFGILFFLLGFHLAKRVEFSTVALDSSALRLGVLISLASLFSLLVDLYLASDVPLLEPIARKKLHVALTYASTFVVLGGLLIAAHLGKGYLEGRVSLGMIRVRVLLLALIITALVSLLGFRTQTIVSILGFTVLMYRYSLVGSVEVLGALGTGVAAFSAIGVYRAMQTGYSIAFSEIVGERIGMTLSIFDFIIRSLLDSGFSGMLTGFRDGSIALATFSSLLGFVPGPTLGPRTLVAREFGVSGVTLTSTLMGAPALDLGLIGLAVFLFLLGAVIGLAFKASLTTGSPLHTAFFSILFAYLLVGIETGLVDFNVFLLFAGSAYLSIASKAEGVGR